MPADPFRKITAAKLLVGEGRDEVRFFEALLGHLHITDVQVVDYEGKGNLARFLAAMPTFPGFATLRSLGITRDADDDPATALASVQSSRDAAAFPPGLQVSIHVLPGGNAPGALENLCLQPIAALPVSACIEEFISCAEHAVEHAPWSVGNAAKARIQAWLAVQTRPGSHLGEAARDRMIDWESPSLAALRDFVAGL